MRLSPLQRFILRECYQRPKLRIARNTFASFYTKKDSPQSIQDSVTNSLERLIDKGLMIGHGRRTPHKWFIEEVRLTATGRRLARKALGVQQTLPLK
jgi:hypothetical protein